MSFQNSTQQASKKLECNDFKYSFHDSTLKCVFNITHMKSQASQLITMKPCLLTMANDSCKTKNLWKLAQRAWVTFYKFFFKFVWFSLKIPFYLRIQWLISRYPWSELGWRFLTVFLFSATSHDHVWTFSLCSRDQFFFWWWWWWFSLAMIFNWMWHPRLYSCSCIQNFPTSCCNNNAAGWEAAAADYEFKLCELRTFDQSSRGKSRERKQLHDSTQSAGFSSRTAVQDTSSSRSCRPPAARPPLVPISSRTQPKKGPQRRMHVAAGNNNSSCIFISNLSFLWSDQTVSGTKFDHLQRHDFPQTGWCCCCWNFFHILVNLMG